MTDTERRAEAIFQLAEAQKSGKIHSSYVTNIGIIHSYHNGTHVINNNGHLTVEWVTGPNAYSVQLR